MGTSELHSNGRWGGLGAGRDRVLPELRLHAHQHMVTNVVVQRTGDHCGHAQLCLGDPRIPDERVWNVTVKYLETSATSTTLEICTPPGDLNIAHAPAGVLVGAVAVMKAIKLGTGIGNRVGKGGAAKMEEAVQKVQGNRDGMKISVRGEYIMPTRWQARWS